MEVNFSGKIGIKYINSSDELINYINNMDGRDRLLDKITNISFFSHGLPNNIPLGYNYDTRNDDLNFLQNQIKDLDANAFDNVYTYFYSCNTGTGDYSFAQAWVNQVGGSAWAVLPKTGETNAQTVYKVISIGQPFNHKTFRFFNEFSLFGFNNLPVAASNAYFRIFTTSK